MSQSNESEWRTLVKLVRSHRVSRVYMPAALLAVVGVLHERSGRPGHVPFGAFEARFRALMRPVSPSGAGRGWQPFFHLAQGVGAWQLVRAGHPAVFEARPKSRGALLRYADGAILAPALLAELQEHGARSVSEKITELLRIDDADDSRALLQSASGSGEGMPG